MKLAEFVERAGQSGATVMPKIDGERERRLWTVLVAGPDDSVAHSGFETLDEGLTSARKWLAALPGEWSWLDEPVDDVDEIAEVFEEWGRRGEVVNVDYSLERWWRFVAARTVRDGLRSLGECLLEVVELLQDKSAPTR